MSKRLFVILSVISSTMIAGCDFVSGSNLQLYCEGQVDHMKSQTQVIFSRKGNEFSVVYPKSMNIKGEIERLYSSDKFTALGSFSDDGAGVWVINKDSLQFAYMQTKDKSFAGGTPFNFDNYTGECRLEGGDIDAL